MKTELPSTRILTLSASEPYNALSRLLDLARVKGCLLKQVNLKQNGNRFHIRIEFGSGPDLFPFIEARCGGITDLKICENESSAGEIHGV